MPPRVRKRKTCSCCEVTSTSQPENVTKRQRVGNKNVPPSEPVREQIVEQPPINQSPTSSVDASTDNQPNQIILSSVFDGEVNQLNEDIVFESEGHLTRRVRSRRCHTVRGRKMVHTFIKEVTYTVCTTRIDYVGQELLPFQKRQNFPEKASSTIPQGQSVTEMNKTEAKSAKRRRTVSETLNDAFFIPSDNSDSESDDSVKNLTKSFVEDDNDSMDSDSSLDSDSDDMWTCVSESGVKCKRHYEGMHDPCYCLFKPCDFVDRPWPEPCPKELENLLKALLSHSEKKKEYRIVKEVNLGSDKCSPCVYLYSNEQLIICNRQRHNLRVDRTFNLGPCYVTMFALRNGNLIDNTSSSGYGPMITGPVMLHFDENLETYVRFFKTIRGKCGLAKKPLTDSAINDMRGILKKDRVITEAMRIAFGSSMNLSNNRIIPTALRSKLKRDVCCWSPVGDVLKVIYTKIWTERIETSRAIRGNRSKSGWRLHPRAEHYLEKWEFSPMADRLRALDKLSLEC